MTTASKPAAALSGTAFASLLLIALMMGANHVAARLAFDNGVDVATAVCFRSTITAGVVALLMWRQRVPVQLSCTAPSRASGESGLLVGPAEPVAVLRGWRACRVALALLAFHLPALDRAVGRLFYGHRRSRASSARCR